MITLNNLQADLIILVIEEKDFSIKLENIIHVEYSYTQEIYNKYLRWYDKIERENTHRKICIARKEFFIADIEDFKTKLLNLYVDA